MYVIFCVVCKVCVLRDYHYLGDLPNIVTAGLLLMYKSKERMFSLSGVQPAIRAQREAQKAQQQKKTLTNN